jgi:hypothetical protein
MYHVTSALNRESIELHGLDWSRMGAARGIAGSASPEVEGCFLLDDEWSIDWFIETINNTGGPVDVWAVEGIEPDQLVENGSGYFYFPDRIPRSSLTIFRAANA